MKLLDFIKSAIFIVILAIFLGAIFFAVYFSIVQERLKETECLIHNGSYVGTGECVIDGNMYQVDFKYCHSSWFCNETVISKKIYAVEIKE